MRKLALAPLVLPKGGFESAMTAPTIKKARLMRIQFVPVVSKVPKYRATKAERMKARECFPEFWASLSESERLRFQGLKKAL